MFVFLFLLVSSFTDVFGYYLADLTLPSKSKVTEHTYEKCLSMRKIFYEDQCWDLLTKGPCDEGQWLVLNWSDDGQPQQQQQQRSIEAKCTKRRCSESDVYWPWDGFCYSTKTANSRRLCPHPNTELVTDEYGDGYCECRNGDKVPYVRVVWDDDDENSQQCYPMYSRGPCPRDHVVSPVGWGYGNCTVDRCRAEHGWNDPSTSKRLRWQTAQQQRETTVAPWTDGRCYELGTRGPCTGKEQFVVLRDTMRPGCVNPVTVLDLFSSKRPETTQPCFTDHSGKCVDAVEFQTNDTSYGFAAQLRESAERHRKRDKKKKKRTPIKLSVI